MQSPLLHVETVSTRIGNQTVHENVTFRIERPSLVAIIGGSGCGKSVLLKEIIRLQRPTSGRITLLGQDVWGSTDEEFAATRTRFSVLFQNGALFSALNVFQNVTAPLREQSTLDEALFEPIAILKLALSGLGPETLFKMPSQLSGGMRKRVALARALALEPELLFLDEPTSGLDPIGARAFDHLVRTLCDSLGITVVLVTHDLDTLAIVDRIIVLGGGRVIADGPLAEVRRSPHPWVKEYFSTRKE